MVITLNLKKMNIYRLLTSIVLCTIVINGCKEERILGPVEQDSVPPGQVKVTNIEPLSGKVNITYTLPVDEDVAYVEAQYQTKNGITRQGRSSAYKNVVTLEGFPDIDTYSVKVYTVDKSENRSEPVVVEVNTLKPDVMIAFESARLADDFGGPNLQFTNPNAADLAAVILYEDAAGDLGPYDTYYTKSKAGYYTARGLPPTPVSMGIYFRDRWSNLSDTLIQVITPYEEKPLDKKKFKAFNLVGDYIPNAYGTPERIWDNNFLTYGQTDPNRAGQAYFTFDLGVTAKLSRFTLWQLPSNSGNILIYNANVNPRLYELWGRATTPTDGSWDGWVRLASCESIKPSGFPTGINTDEDVAAAAKGEEWNISLDAAPVRYIRFKCLSNWLNGGGSTIVGEMSFWGKEQ
jgi:hypothetical protein